MVDDGKEESQQDAAARRARGEFVRGVSGLREVLGESAALPPEPGRYHLFVALNCPWCHRVTLARTLLGLEESISMDVAFPNRTGEEDPMGPNLWQFAPEKRASLTGETLPECTLETATGQGYRRVKEIYLAQGAQEQSVPVLYDKQTRCIVNNESAEILRMFNRCAEALGSTRPADERPDLYPRDDPVYALRMKLNAARILDYPWLWAWLCRVHAMPGVAEISALTHCRQGYFGRSWNGVVPLGPERPMPYPDAYRHPDLPMRRA